MSSRVASTAIALEAATSPGSSRWRADHPYNPKGLVIQMRGYILTVLMALIIAAVYGGMLADYLQREIHGVIVAINAAIGA